MQKYSTITSKRQLTIPAQIFRAAFFKEGQKVLVRHQNGTVVIEPAVAHVEKLAGSVRVPKRFKALDLDEIIRRAKQEYQKRDRI